MYCSLTSFSGVVDCAFLSIGAMTLVAIAVITVSLTFDAIFRKPKE